MHARINMGAKLGISYEYKNEECRVISFPPDMPFEGCFDKLTLINSDGIDKYRLKQIALIEGLYNRFEEIADLLSISENPADDIIYIASLASSGEPVWIRLFYTLLIAVPPMETIVEKYADFNNLNYIMNKIANKEAGGKSLGEKETWFRKKVFFLSSSYILPGPSDAENPWLVWGRNVRKALADPDERWDNAIRERVMAELDARSLRISRIAAQMDTEVHSRIFTELVNESENIKWIQKTLEIRRNLSEGSTLLIRNRLENQWESVMDSLRNSKAGELLAAIFEFQTVKAHSYPQIKMGTSVLKAIFQHPVLSRSSLKVDIFSCLYHFAQSAGQGKMELLISSGKIDKELLAVQGFDINNDILTVNLDSVRSDMFVGDFGVPVDFDWSKPIEDNAMSYKSLVLSYLDNTTFLTSVLNNPKISGKPGIVSLIASRCKAASVLTLIAGRRDLYTGFANKDVPLMLLTNPARIPISSLRKFIHVKYIDKLTLQQLAARKGNSGQIREEVRREIVQIMKQR